MDPRGKYSAFPSVELPNRTWPGRTITKAPRWCSVDLRDGNQALVVPMTVTQKIEMFKLLVGCGFKEIEVGFPSASGTEYEFVRRIIDGGLIPDGVTIQVLTQAREELIARTVESLVGAKKAIIHLYNSTSPAQRRIVFGKSKPEIVAIAVRGAKLVREHTAKLDGTEVILEYSPESFSATESDFAVEICEAVMDVWQPTPDRKMIMNLPDTVQVSMPNVYADQVEWFCTRISRRDSVIVSLHVHNDRGTGVAATELGILAGADRVEGTLFGNGERTGNTDLVTVALNMYAQGIDPGLDFSNLGPIRETYERCTGMVVPPRQPYSGELVFTAFSGSHQDAISKGLAARRKSGERRWEVPYLPLDPADVGGELQTVVRINSQSGKGGIGHLLERDCGLRLPRRFLMEFASIAGRKIDAFGSEVGSSDLRAMLWAEYVERFVPFRLEDFRSADGVQGCTCEAAIVRNEEHVRLKGTGNGPIDAFVQSLALAGVAMVLVCDQAEHALGNGADAKAIAYIEVQFPDGGKRWGVGVDTNIELASIRAILSALNRE